MASCSSYRRRYSRAKKLTYSIHKCSSYSSSYYPDNILEDRPKDQGSRWSSESNTPPQFLILKLQRASIVEVISFGKYEKTHVCNLKKFKVFGGLDEDNMIELLESGLKNDSSPETFVLKHEIGTYAFPCRFLKIVPLQSWGPSFNFSIWYLELSGVDDIEEVGPALTRFNDYREREALRVCLKHLREFNYLEAVECLVKKTKIQLEDPLMTELHTILVKNGDYDEAERFIERAAVENLFQDYISRYICSVLWNQIMEPSSTFQLNPGNQVPIEDFQRPGMRGGHQMVLDSANETIYLFGGWDGQKDLGDLWAFNVQTHKWMLITPNTELVGGPSPRSCHKMCLSEGKIFCLGRYLDSVARPNRYLMKSDFYVYDIATNKWSLISEDTGSIGGPQLVFDHQMCIDKDTLYVFGGRILSASLNISESLNLDLFVVANNEGGVVGRVAPVAPPEEDVEDIADRIPASPPDVVPNYLENEMIAARNLVNLSRNNQIVGENREEFAEGEGEGGSVSGNAGLSSISSANSELSYSGLFSYCISTNTWTQLRCDIATPKPTKNVIRSRVGHSMLFHPKLKKLFIFAGQRSKEYLNDFFTYDIELDNIEIISDGSKQKLSLPATGFTQRATIDPDLNEIYIFSGLSKDKDKRDEHVQNSFWVYDIIRKNWSCVFRNDSSSGEIGWNPGHPCPRFAHQLVYDPFSKSHFLFGGNPGRSKDPKLRLDDFWRLKLIRPTKDELLNKCKLLLRRSKFEELAQEKPLEALFYLQSSLSELIDHTDPVQTSEFQRLTLLLFSDCDDDDAQYIAGFREKNKEDEYVRKRSQLFDKLICYFPDSMTHPKINLIDLLPL